MSAGSPEREICPQCGFEWEAIDASEVKSRVNETVGELATLVLANSSIAGQRPLTSRWSALEYGAHVRDVLLVLRDRLVVTVVEDTPNPHPLYRDERVNLGLYGHETPTSVADGLEMAARMFTTAFEILRHDYGDRTLHYGYPSPSIRTLAWTGAQALHECTHHLGDARENVTLLSRN